MPGIRHPWQKTVGRQGLGLQNAAFRVNRYLGGFLVVVSETSVGSSRGSLGKGCPGSNQRWKAADGAAGSSHWLDSQQNEASRPLRSQSGGIHWHSPAPRLALVRGLLTSIAPLHEFGTEKRLAGGPGDGNECPRSA